MNLQGKAQSNYPSKQIVNSDTVICSTIEQQKKYLIWKSERDECREKSDTNLKTIYLMDSVIKTQSKMLALYEWNSAHYEKIARKLNEINDNNQERIGLLSDQIKQSEKRNKRQKLGFVLGGTLFMIGLSTLTILLK